MPTVCIDDIDLHYVEAGVGAPLLLIHGLGGSHQDWRHQIAAFAQHFRVIAPDLRGFGASGAGRRRISIPRYARDLQTLLDVLDIEHCTLVGHSMGGAIAQQMALDQAPRIDRLVIANSVPTFRPQTCRQRAEFAYRFVVMGLFGPALLAQIGARRMYPGDDQTQARANSAARGARTSRYSYLSALAALGRWSVLERLGALQQPVLVLASEHDYYSREQSTRFARALPRGRLHVVAHAHHALPSELPELFNRLTLQFLLTDDMADAAAPVAVSTAAVGDRHEPTSAPLQAVARR